MCGANWNAEIGKQTRDREQAQVKKQAPKSILQIDGNGVLVFNNNNLTIKGPGGGLLPKYLEMLKNRTVNKFILKDTPITWEDV